MGKRLNKTELIWFDRFKELLSKYHKKNINKLANRLLKKTKTIRYSMLTRSKKYGVKCDITVNDLRELILIYYGRSCKYDPTRQVTYKNMVFDHIIPISKGGESTKSNIQIISRFSNSMKGSLTEDNFYILLRWLDSIDPELKKDISVRLAGGKR